MAKYRLEERSDPRVVVYGISCHVPDYRLCWSLNKALDLDLTKRREDIVEETKGSALHYPVFEQMGEEGERTWWLVSNLCGKRRLLPQQKEAVHFLVIDEEVAARAADVLERLRGAEFVLTAFPIASDALKMGHKLLL